MTEPSTRPELLAPAGSLESFIAAMEAGADAVYAGLRDFSARAKARNFTLADMEQISSYAHGLGRRVYVTLNTLVKERELPQLVETLATLEAMEIDGVILQDLAVARLARDHFPGLELHASTQMTIHNAAGVKMLERMGFTRGVLARELSLAEIASIRKETTLELEHFIHGALCFSFSGQCYFSSWLGGKSGNRGRCAQPCRRRYSYRQQQGYYFSTNDLSAIDLLPELTAAGVCSLKIEGRMKSAEYVSAVVGAYRRVLDAHPKGRAEAVKAAKEQLKQSFGRLPTRGFLPGGVPTDIAVPSIKGATGRFLGEVSAVRGGAVTFCSRDRLHVGDRLRIQPRSDKAGTAFTVKELFQGKRPVKAVGGGTVVTVPSPFQDLFRVGDAVFKVSSEQAFTLSDAACRRRLTAATGRPVPVRMEVSLVEGLLHLKGEAAGLLLERSYPVEAFAAQESPLSAETLSGVFSRSGGEPLALENLSASSLPPVVIPPSRLKEIRRDFYRELSAALRRQGEERLRKHRASALAALLPPASSRPSPRREITVGLRDLRELQLLDDPGIDRLLVPLTPATLQMVERSERRLRRYRDRLVFELPLILFDPEWEGFRQAVRSLANREFTRFRLNNLGHFPLFDGLEGMELETGYRLFSLNSQAILAWKELGASRTGLYIEDDRDNFRDLLSRETGIPCHLQVYGTVPLITSRIPIRGVRPDQPVLSDRDEAYRVDGRGGLTVLTSETDFSLFGRLGEIQSLGCGHFTLDLSHLGSDSSRGRRVLEALRRDEPLSGTSPFNFESGLE